MKEKKCLPILLAVWPYFMIALLQFWDSDNSYFITPIVCLSLVLTIVIPILNIVNACTYKSADDDYQLAFWNMLIKLIHIPFYVGMYIVGVLLLLAVVVPAMLFVTPILVVILVIISFLLMVTSSTYGINAIIRAKKKGGVSTGFVVSNIILHLVFVADVISAIMVFVKIKKNKRSECMR